MIIHYDNDGQMIFGILGGLKLPDIYLTGEEKPRKNLTQEIVQIGDRIRVRCATGAHATAWSTAVDLSIFFYLNVYFFNFRTICIAPNISL